MYQWKASFMGYLNMLIRNIHIIFIILQHLDFKFEESIKMKKIVLNICWPRVPNILKVKGKLINSDYRTKGPIFLI